MTKDKWHLQVAFRSMSMRNMLRWFLALAWAYVGFAKVLAVISSAGRLPIVAPWVHGVAACLELALSVLLVSRWWRFGAVASIVMSGCFAVSSFVAHALGWKLAECGCAGGKPLSWVMHATLAVGLLGLSVVVARCNGHAAKAVRDPRTLLA